MSTARCCCRSTRRRSRHDRAQLVERSTASRRSRSRSCTPIAIRSTSGARPRSSARPIPTLPLTLSSRGRARDSRIRAHQHGLRQRLCAAADAPLSRPAGGTARRHRLRRPPLRDALGRRHRGRAGGQGLPDPHDRVRPGGRRHGGLVSRAARRSRSGGLVRHGRHHRQDVPGRERRARPQVRFRGRPRAPLRQGLGHAAEGLGRRHDRDRRRRRIDRARRAGLRPDEGRTAQRRRQARPGLLRPRRRRADGHRRRPGAGPAQSRLLPGRRDASRARSRAWRFRARRGARAQAADAGDRARRPAHRRRDHGGGDPHASRREGPRPAPLYPDRVRRRRTGARLQPRPAAQDAARDRAVRRRRRFCAWASWWRRRRPTWCAATWRGSSGSTGTWSTRCSPRWRKKASKLLVEAGADPAAITLRPSADMRHVGQGFEIPVPLPSLTLGRRRSCGDPRGLLRELSRALRPHREGLARSRR